MEQLLTLGVGGAVIEAPVSDSKLAAYGITRAKILDRIASAVSFAQGNGLRVCFFAVDATRSDPSFLREAYQAAVAAGAQEVTAVDTLGIASPEAAALLVQEVSSWVGPSVPVHWHGHNDFGLATAGAVAAVRAGAQWIQGTINGMGERAGNTNLPEVALALEALYGVHTGLRFDKAVEVADWSAGCPVTR